MRGVPVEKREQNLIPSRHESGHRDRDSEGRTGREKKKAEKTTRTDHRLRADSKDRDKHRNRENQETMRQVSQIAGKPEKIPHRSRFLEDPDKNREKERQGMISHINQLEKQLDHARRHSMGLEEQCRRQSEEIHITSNQLRAAEVQHQQTRQALALKASELKGAQTFLTKGDLLSGADVIAMIHMLNAEILQISAYIADALGSTGMWGGVVSEEGRAARNRANQRIGEPLVRALTNKFLHEELDPDPLPLQIALQIALVRSCAEVIESWIPGYPSHEDVFKAIYSELQQTEEQSVSARWRAITRSQIKRVVDVRFYLLGLLSEDITNLLVLVGWSRGQLKQESFLETARERLVIIVNLALRLQTAVGEDITSGDMKTYIVPSNAEFNQSTMDDVFPEGRGRPRTDRGGRVAGTTDIGLQRSVRGSGPVILSKPKVVLHSALDD